MERKSIVVSNREMLGVILTARIIAKRFEKQCSKEEARIRGKNNPDGDFINIALEKEKTNIRVARLADEERKRREKNPPS